MRESDVTPFSTALSITMTATNNSLARVIAFLHKRGAHVRHLNWIAPERRGGHARMTVVAHFDQDRTQNLRTSLALMVDVLDVRDTSNGAGPANADSTWW